MLQTVANTLDALLLLLLEFSGVAELYGNNRALLLLFCKYNQINNISKSLKKCRSLPFSPVSLQRDDLAVLGDGSGCSWMPVDKHTKFIKKSSAAAKGGADNISIYIVEKGQIQDAHQKLYARDVSNNRCPEKRQMSHCSLGTYIYKMFWRSWTLILRREKNPRKIKWKEKEFTKCLHAIQYP